jgi:uridine kinase
MRIWIDCSFETAMKRAITRSQEQLSPEETIEAYETIYFLAQRLHFTLDQPQVSAHLSIMNN